MAIEEPKKPQNAYWLYLVENRDALSKEAGSSKVPVVGKLAGSRWKAMTAEKKKPYEEKAEDSKREYEKAMEFFREQGGVVGKRRQEKAENRREALGKRAKKNIDPDKPKRPQTAYWLWLGESRASLVAEIGKNDVTQVSKLGGQRWNALPQACKGPYEAKAVELKAQYDKDMEEWRKNVGDAAAAAEDQ